jgi:hypothetical protein
MKALLLYLFLALQMTLSLIPRSDVSELSKVSILIEHFIAWNEQASAAQGFSDFLVEHYHGSHSKDDPAHSNLPLNNLSSQPLLVFIQESNPKTAIMFFESAVTSGFEEDHHHSEKNTLELIQPPRN